MNKNLFLIFGVMFLFFSLAFVSSAPPFSTSVTDKTVGIGIGAPMIDVLKVNQSFDFNFHIFNATDGMPLDNSTIQCYFHLYNQTGKHIYYQLAKHDLNSEHLVANEWSIDVTASNLTNNGMYSYIIQCNNSLIGGNSENSFVVTPTGEPLNEIQLYSRIFIILLCISLVILIQWNSSRVNYDSWYNKMTQQYQEKNIIKWSLSAVAFNLMKNSYIFSYLVGLVGLLVLTNLTYFFNIISVLTIMKIVLGLYTWSAIIVCLIFFSQVQEWITGWVKDVQNMNWGFEK